MFCSGSISLFEVLFTKEQQQPFNGRLSGTTRVGRYQKKHSPAHTHPGQRTSFITFLHLQRSTSSSLFSLRAWQSSRTTCFQVLFGLPLGLEPSTYTPCISSPNHHHLFAAHAHTNAACSAAISMLCHLHLVSLSSLLGSLSFSLTPHIHPAPVLLKMTDCNCNRKWSLNPHFC